MTANRTSRLGTRAVYSFFNNSANVQSMMDCFGGRRFEPQRHGEHGVSGRRRITAHDRTSHVALRVSAGALRNVGSALARAPIVGSALARGQVVITRGHALGRATRPIAARRQRSSWIATARLAMTAGGVKFLQRFVCIIRTRGVLCTLGGHRVDLLLG